MLLVCVVAVLIGTPVVVLPTDGMPVVVVVILGDAVRSIVVVVAFVVVPGVVVQTVWQWPSR